MRSILIKFFLSIFIFSVFLCSVNADGPSIDSHAGAGSIGSSSSGSGGGSAFWASGDGVIGFRVTMVDSSGKKVTGTRSVDFVNDASDGKTISDYKGYKLLYGDKYKYRLSDKFTDYNNSTEHVFYGANTIPHSSPSELSIASQKIIDFLDTYLINYSSDKMSCSSSWGLTGVCETDFLTIFLRYSNYMTDNSADFRNLPSDKYTKLQDYYLSIEMLFSLATNYGKFYGTGYEFLNAFYDGYVNSSYSGPNKQAFKNMTDNISDERSYFACSLYTNTSIKNSMFENYFDSTRSCIEGSIEKYFGGLCRNFTIAGMEDLNYGCGWTQNTDYGLMDIKNFKKNSDKAAAAVGMYSLADVITPLYKATPFNLNICNQNYTTTLSSSIFVDQDYLFEKDFFAQNSNSDPLQTVYCIDSTTFDYRDTFVGDSDGSDGRSGIAGTKLLDSSFKVYPIKATVRRTCVFSSNTSYNMVNSVMKDYNKNIIINAYGNNYSFSYSVLNGSEPNSICNSNDICQKTGNFVINYELDNNVVINRSRVDVGGKVDLNTEYTGYIDFSNYDDMFGASNKFIKTIESKADNSLCFNGGTYVGLANDKSKCLKSSNGTADLYYIFNVNKNGVEDGKCKFNYKIEGDETIPSDSASKFRFRTISLENPFPARDGTSRFPRSNWLDIDNKVFPYITNNRGIRYVMKSDFVSPEEMYRNSDIKPMYTVTLTPADMVKIRKYNKNNDYNSMYTSSNMDYRLNCDSEGRQCYSGFLRSDYVSNISGICLISTNKNLLRAMMNVDKTVYPAESDVFNVIKSMQGGNLKRYSMSYDLNKDYRIDNDDLLLSKEINHGKNTVYYTCANKTFLSGGPYYEEVDK